MGELMMFQKHIIPIQAYPVPRQEEVINEYQSD